MLVTPIVTSSPSTTVAVGRRRGPTTPTTTTAWKRWSSIVVVATRQTLLLIIASLVACRTLLWSSSSSSLSSRLDYFWNRPEYPSSSSSSSSWSFQHFGISSAFSDELYFPTTTVCATLSCTPTTNTTPLVSIIADDRKLRLLEDCSCSCPPQHIHMTQESNVIWKKCDDHDVEPKYVVNMTISFTLPYPKCHSAIVRVLYGPTTPDSKDIIPTNKTLVVEETPIQFQYNASLAVPTLKEEYQSDYIYHVTLPELLAGRVEYWYIIQTEIEELRTLKFLDDEDHMIFGKRVDDNVTLRTMMLLSKVNTDMTFFHTPPLPPLATEEELSEEEEEETNEDQSSSFSSSSPTVLALVGDLGQTENSTKTMKHIYDGVIAGNISSVIIAGDLSYADGDPFRWTRWMELMEPLLKIVPLFSVPGNHEIECDASTFQVFQQYEAYFRNPNRISSPDILPIPKEYKDSLWSCLTASQFLGHYNYGNSFWSVQHGMVHLIGLNSYTSVLPDSPQYQWFQQELAHNVNRTQTPWLLVVFHCPLHTTFLGHDGEINPLLMLQAIEPLLVQYQVNLVVSGHDHAYLRTHPMVGETVNEDGPIYWTLGAGGNREHHNKGYIHDIPESWVAQRDLSEYGYGQFRAVNATYAQMIWIRDDIDVDATTTTTSRMTMTDDVWIENIWHKQQQQEPSKKKKNTMKEDEEQDGTSRIS